MDAPSGSWQTPPETANPGPLRRWVRRHRRALVALVALALLAYLAYAAYFFLVLAPAGFAQAERVENDVKAASRGLITDLVRLDENGQPRWTIWTLHDSAGVDIACQVVRPTLARDGFPNPSFEVRDETSGLLLAPDATSCPTASPSHVTP